MNPETRLTILFDCCHSGSACELPYVFRPDEDGNINLMDQLKKGVGLVRAAEHLIQGGWSRDKVSDAKMLLGGATDFFNSLHHMHEGQTDEEGLAAENFKEHWETEGKDVWMFSGCADMQTSADATISGKATGAMSWAFIGTMRENPELSYVQVRPVRRAVRSQVADGAIDIAKYARASPQQVPANSATELWWSLRPRPAASGECRRRSSSRTWMHAQKANARQL